MAGGPLVGSDGGVRESAFGWAKGPGGQGEGGEGQGRDVVGGGAAGGQVRGGGAEHVDQDAGIGPFLQSGQSGGGNDQPGEDLRGAQDGGEVGGVAQLGQQREERVEPQHVGGATDQALGDYDGGGDPVDDPTTPGRAGCGPGAHRGSSRAVGCAGTAQTAPALNPAAPMPRARLNRPRRFSSAMTWVNSTSWVWSKRSRRAANSSSVTSTGVRLIAVA